MERIDFSLGEAIPSLERKEALLLGEFDGLHLGHQELINKALSLSDAPAVLLFSKPLGAYLSRKSETLLTSLEDRIRLFGQKGIERAYVIKTDPSFLSLSPEEFIEKVLLPLSPKAIVVGEDYQFGKGGAGDILTLRKYFDTHAIPLLTLEGKKVGTREILSFLTEGKIMKANRFLGHPYEIHGKVVHGFENGRKIGFPTANLSLDTPYKLPKEGVYRGLCYLRGIPYPSIVNVGKAPTIGLLKKSLVECYLDGFLGDCYNETIYLAFEDWIRGEIQFSSMDALRDQLGRDLCALRKGKR